MQFLIDKHTNNVTNLPIGTDKDRMLNNFGKFNQIAATSVCHMCKYESAYIAWNVFTIEVIIPAKQNPA